MSLTLTGILRRGWESMGHLPLSQEGVPARETDVEAEAVDDDATKLRASAHTNLLSPEDLWMLPLHPSGSTASDASS
jgi:hypothetical protein